MQVNIHEAKTRLSQLLVEVEQGREVIIARGGRPIARLVPLDSNPGPRTPGSARGQFVVPASFFEPLPDDIIQAFEG
ncbi:MAG: type II toxin-antitoxin system Phd/YefM family antitoxin [Candidatus Eremiobacterota bacterium]